MSTTQVEIKAVIKGCGPTATASTEEFEVSLLGRKCKLYASGRDRDKWTVALPHARNSRWAAGLRQFETYDEAVAFIHAVATQGTIKIA